VQRAGRRRPRTEDDALGSASVHPDLHDLSFGTLGPEQRNLQPPIRPKALSSDEEQDRFRGSLSDFSDYESSDEETRHHAGQSSSLHARKAYVNVSDDGGDDVKDARVEAFEDPFADPFAD